MNVFSIFLGDTKTMFLRAINVGANGDPLDLTQATQIVAQLPNADGSFTSLKLSLSQVVISQPPVLGNFSIPLSGEVSALLNVGVEQSFDVTFTIGGQVFTVRYAQALSVFEVR